MEFSEEDLISIIAFLETLDDDNEQNKSSKSQQDQLTATTIEPVSTRTDRTNNSSSSQTSSLSVPIHDNNQLNPSERYKLDDTTTPRLQHLMSFPERHQAAINAGNLTLLRKIFEEDCTEDLLLQPASVLEFYGREQAIQYILSVCHAVPDLVILYTPCKRINRVISTKVYSEGTRISKETVSDRYNPFKNKYTDPLLTTDTINKYTNIEENNKILTFKSISYMHLIINKDMNYIEKIILSRKSMIVDEYKN